MQDHRLQPQRYELKYLVREEMTWAMRDFIACFLELDDFSVGQPNYSYPIHSVYLDSDGMHTHNATRNGDKNRFKLRLRYYNDKPGSPVFFEIKQRIDNSILKQRCPVKRDAVPLLLSGQLPDQDHLLSSDPRHLVALQRFTYLQQQLGARPKLHNNYQREAWVSSGNNSIRVTFDRNIYIEPYFGNQAIVPLTRARHIYSDFVVLELKFTNRFPNWFRDMVERFDLMRSTASKYSGGVETFGEWSFVNDPFAAQAGLELPFDPAPEPVKQNQPIPLAPRVASEI